MPNLVLYRSIGAGGELSGGSSKLRGRIAGPSGMLSWTITHPVNWPKQLLTLNVTSDPEAGRGMLGPSFALHFHPWERYQVSFLPGHPPPPLPQDQGWPLGIKDAIPDAELSFTRKRFSCVFYGRLGS